MVPRRETGLSESQAEAHCHYTRHVNFRENWKGYLWHGHFASFTMDEAHLFRAVRYVELNPIRTGFCSRSDRWKWSSAMAHLTGIDDELVSVRPMLERVENREGYLRLEYTEGSEFDELRQHERTGRPLGTKAYIEWLEKMCSRSFWPHKPGPKPGS